MNSVVKILLEMSMQWLMRYARSGGNSKKDIAVGNVGVFFNEVACHQAKKNNEMEFKRAYRAHQEYEDSQH